MDKTGHMTIAAHTAGRRNGRQWMRRFLLAAVLLLAAVAVAGICLEERAVVTDFFAQKICRRALSICLGRTGWGVICCRARWRGSPRASASVCWRRRSAQCLRFSLELPRRSAEKWADGIISWCIDLMMGVPHIVLLLLISYALGKGEKGVVVGVALTHWPNLARVIRGGDPAGAGGGVRWHCKTAREKSVVHCQMAHFFRRFFRSSLWDWCYCSRTRSCMRRASRFWALDCRRRSRRLA